MFQLDHPKESYEYATTKLELEKPTPPPKDEPTQELPRVEPLTSFYVFSGISPPQTLKFIGYIKHRKVVDGSTLKSNMFSIEMGGCNVVLDVKMVTHFGSYYHGFHGIIHEFH
jgi:hypothetical protein